MNGTLATINGVLDPDKLELTLTVKGDVKAIAPYKGVDADFFGKPVSGDRMPGPFTDLLTGPEARSVDPR